MTDELHIIEANPSIFPERFSEWFEQNQPVWEAFVREARAIRARGFKRYSAKTIIHVLRHHSATSETGCGWKLNNDHSPYLARLFDLRYPDMAGMWSLRDTPKVRRTRRDRTANRP
jgi:hypothetical protein